MPHVVPKSVQPRFDEIVTLIDAVCRTHLTDEYADMARKMAISLARKRPSPLLRGHSRTWACGITHAVGTVNFSGRGWAVLRDDQLQGRLFIHRGDDSTFTARRAGVVGGASDRKRR